jgi:hypothetical protein
MERIVSKFCRLCTVNAFSFGPSPTGNCVTNCFPARASWDAEEHYMMDRYEVSSYHNCEKGRLFDISTFQYDL